MRSWAKGAKPAALLALGVMAFSGNGVAFADTDGDHSVGGGNQLNLPVTLPVDISGNAVGVLGSAEGQSRGGAAVIGGGEGAGGNRTSGRSSVLGGNQVVAPITAPVNACGNAVSLFGSSEAGCRGGAAVVNKKGKGKGGPNAGGNRTSGRSSVLGGNQVVAPITAPVNACGNAVAVLGDAAAGCRGGAAVVNKGKGKGGPNAGGNRTNGRSSVLGGNQVVAPITAPVNACGNAVSLFGSSEAGCRGGAAVVNKKGKGKGGPNAGGNRTSGRSSVLGGNQVVAPITAPVNVCGNSVAVLGGAFSGCAGGAKVVTGGGHGHGYGGKHRVRGAGGNDTDGRFGAGSGNQVIAPIALPVNACGNAVGNSTAACKGGAAVVGKSGQGAGGNRTSGRSSVLGGNQVVAPITAPVNVCGNAVSVLGDAFAGCKGGAAVIGKGKGGPGAGHNRTDGRSSVLGGNQVVAPITAPVNVCGNAAAVLGRSEAACAGGAKVVGPVGQGAGGNRTSGRSSVLGGNQVVAPITAPVNVCGNAAAVLGDAAAGCLGSAKVGRGHGHGPYKAVPVRHSAGLLSVAPLNPATGGSAETRKINPGRPKLPATTSAASLVPVPGGVPQLPGQLPPIPGGLTTLPNLPLASSLPVTLPLAGGVLPQGSAATAKAAPAKHADAQGGPLAGTPVGDALPLGNVGLMSAEQPAGVTGMNLGALLALGLGTLFAASATLFALTRRFRPSRGR